MDLDGRDISQHPLVDHGEIEVKRYRVKEDAGRGADVLAAYATDFGELKTDTGPQQFAPGDYIVTDLNPTHAWTRPGAAFESIYEEGSSY